MFCNIKLNNNEWLERVFRRENTKLRQTSINNQKPYSGLNLLRKMCSKYTLIVEDKELEIILDRKLTYQQPLQ